MVMRRVSRKEARLPRTVAVLENRIRPSNPVVSPVYGDLSNLPPTLIQVGTKEIFFSNSVRHYQALDQAGIEVKLDPYEGMWHVFQFSPWGMPESYLARKKMAAFLRQYLDY